MREWRRKERERKITKMTSSFPYYTSDVVDDRETFDSLLSDLLAVFTIDLWGSEEKNC